VSADPAASPVERVRALFEPAEGLTYLDTATYGLPPRPTVEAMAQALARWQDGTAHWIDDWDVEAERARTAFAALVGASADEVALIPSASVGVGTVAASLTPDDRVVVPDDEFTSLLFPLLVAAERGTTVTQVPFEALVERIGPDTTLVATSLVQMQTGRVADLHAIVDRANRVGAPVLVDATHGIPFATTDGVLGGVDFVVCAAYKHLLCPRGVGFLVVRRAHLPTLAPWNANWRATDDPYGRYVGGPLTLADGASRFDVSLAWLPWLGAAVSLELMASWAGAGLLAQPVDQARELAARLGVTWGGSSIVCAPVADPDAVQAAVDRHRVKLGFRGDGIRLSTHVYTTDADLDRAVAVLGPLVGGGS
jgi:selenocysteine lyase/cysteine desulfurase